MHGGHLFSEILIFVIRKQIVLVRIVKMKGILELVVVGDGEVVSFKEKDLFVSICRSV